MRVVTLDVETSAERQPDGSFPPLYRHSPEIVTWIVSDGTSFDLRHWDRAEEPEASGLQRIAADLKSSDRCTGWNIRCFDLPLLSLRSLALGVDWSWYESRRHRYPTWKQALWSWDMLEQISDYGAARGLPLDGVAKLLGLPGKVGIDGSQVGEALARGERDRVRAYCSNDSFEALVIYYRYMASHCGAPAAREAADRALVWAADHPLLSRFYGAEAQP